MPRPSDSFTCPEAAYRRTVTAPFTKNILKHHPFLDPNFPDKDMELVPWDLAPRGGLSWVLPKTPTTTIVMQERNGLIDSDQNEWKFKEKIEMIREYLRNEEDNMSGAVRIETNDNSFAQTAQAFEENSGEAEQTSYGDSDSTMSVPNATGTFSRGATQTSFSRDASKLGTTNHPSDRRLITVQPPKRTRSSTLAKASDVPSHLTISDWADAVVTADYFPEESAYQQPHQRHPVSDARASIRAIKGGSDPIGLQDKATGLSDRTGSLKQTGTDSMSENDGSEFESLGPYDSFWLKNDVYGRGEKRALPELRRRAGSLRLRNEFRVPR